jgi:hypothetical protein
MTVSFNSDRSSHCMAEIAVDTRDTSLLCPLRVMTHCLRRLQIKVYWDFFVFVTELNLTIRNSHATARMSKLRT